MQALLDTFSGARQGEIPPTRRTIMKWLASVRSVLTGGSRSAPVTPAASPNMPSKADLRAKQVGCEQDHNARCLTWEAECFAVV